MINPVLFKEYPTPENAIQCALCPNRCIIPENQEGCCGARENRHGKPSLPWYGLITSLGVDPLSKKPLYHYRPGGEVFSVGFKGCNLHCPFCQNWEISQEKTAPAKYFSPDTLIKEVQASGQDCIAYTYSEPLIHVEYLLETMARARNAGIANILVTNGCFNGAAADALLKLTDAVNVDLKSASPETYRDVLGGDLGTVCQFLRNAFSKKVHLEVTTLVVPQLNDSPEELLKCASIVRELSPRIPWHVSAYRPAYHLSTPATDPGFLIDAAKTAGKDLAYVYTGNISGGLCDTRCPECGELLVHRKGFRADVVGLAAGAQGFVCGACKKPADFIR